MEHSSCHVDESTSHRELGSLIIGQNILDLVNGYVLLNASQVSPHDLVPDANDLQTEILYQVEGVQNVNEHHHYQHHELVSQSHPR